MDNAILKTDSSAASRLQNDRRQKGQGLLEMSCVLISMILLLGGIVNIFLWANKQIVKRQIAYNSTRQLAGTSSDYYQYVGWGYIPPALSEDKVILDIQK